MQINSTPNVLANNTVSSDTVANPSQTLNQNDFLQLLVSQMENQDPLNPESDTDMAAQMAQFTSLQQSSAMSASLAMLQANSLIGSTVVIQVNSQQTASGVVQGVQLGAASSDGNPQIIVDGTAYDVSQVLAVAPPTTNQTTDNTNK